MPNLAFKAVFCKLFPQNRIGFADGLKPFPRDGTQAAHAKTRAWEGLAIYHAVGQAERFAYDADFVLEQEAKRLNELKL